MLSSTGAYGMGAMNKTVSLESGDGGSLSSTHEVVSDCRPRNGKRNDSEVGVVSVPGQYPSPYGAQTPLDTQFVPSRAHSILATSAARSEVQLQSVSPVVQSNSLNLVGLNVPSVDQPQSVSPVVQYQSVPTVMPNQHPPSQYVPLSNHDRRNTSQSAASPGSHGAHVPLCPAPVAHSFLPSSSVAVGHAPAAVSHQFLSPVVGGTPASFVPAVPAADVSNVSLGDLRSVMRRDLRFKSFGKEGKVDYIQVEKQIRQAEKKKYEASEIIDAVVDALPAGSEFRSVLLLKSGSLTVDGLLDLLHSEYLEVDNSDLVTQLTTAHQTAKEDETTFLNRLIKLKDRILYEGQDGGLNISEDALTQMLLKALESGLANERIVTRLLPLFSQSDVSDADLKREMSKAVRACKGRRDKAEKTEKKQVRIALVGEEAGKSREREREESEFLKVAKELKEEVAEVK